MQGIEFTFTGKYSKVQLFDSGKEFGRDGIPVIWTTYWPPKAPQT